VATHKDKISQLKSTDECTNGLIAYLDQL